MDIELLKIDLERITGQRAIEEGESMVNVLARLDTMAASSQIHAQLEHYLSKRSYMKALAWLDDPTAPHQL